MKVQHCTHPNISVAFTSLIFGLRLACGIYMSAGRLSRVLKDSDDMTGAIQRNQRISALCHVDFYWNVRTKTSPLYLELMLKVSIVRHDVMSFIGLSSLLANFVKT